MPGKAGRSGRKRTTNEQKILRGTNQKVRMVEGTDLEPISKLPTPMDYLDDEGVLLYESMGEKFKRAGILNEFNIEMFTALISELSNYHKLQREIRLEGFVIRGALRTETNPKVRLADACFKNVRSMCTEFGMTPSSFIKMAAIISQNKPKDPYEEFKNK